MLSAICFAASHVVSKRGLRDTSVVGGSIVVLAVSWCVIALSVALDPPESVTGSGIAIFGVLGLFVPAISRAAALKGIDALGPSIAIPIQQGLRPVLSVVGAMLILGESIGLVRGVGILAIIGGGWHLSRRPRESRERGGEGRALEGSGSATSLTVSVPDRIALRVRGLLRPGVAFPAISALSFAAFDLIVRGTRSLVEPGFAAMVSSGTGLLAWLVAVSLVPAVRRRLHLGAGTRWLVLAGALVGVAILTAFHALERGTVSLVVPIHSSQPLFVFLLSWLLLRDLERITLSTVLSGLAVVAGAVFVSW